MEPVQELLQDTNRQIGEAYARLSTDLLKIRERYGKDWMRCDFERRVRWAQYTLETADLERQRMMLIRQLAVAPLAHPIVTTIGN